MRQKFSILLTAVLLFSLLIVPTGSASAATNYVQDPSLEGAVVSTAIWQQSSTNSDTPICSVAGCGTDVTAAPRTGTAWAWFGGLDWSDLENESPEDAGLSQMVTFPTSCGASLQFYFWIGEAAGDANDTFSALIDGTAVFSANATQQSTYPSYTLVNVNLAPALANGAAHKVEFFSRTVRHNSSSTQTVTFNLDDIAIVPTCFAISGNAGTPGATINYTGGSTVADGSGNYSFTVPADWNGTVTPSKPGGFVFSPPSRTYTNVAANQTAQDYSAFVGFTISGTVAGVTGWSNPVTLSYTDVTPKTVTAQLDGSYTIPVPAGWTGTVTPSHPCYTFTPPSRNYNNVLANQTSNYTATFNNSAPLCAVTTGVFRPVNGLIFLKNSNTTGIADVALNYGNPGDYPVVGDWDGNGTVTIGIYRDGNFYLRNSNTIGFADTIFPFGLAGDQPVAGDWDGDGTDTIGVYRNGTFYLRDSNSSGNADLSFGLGNPGDVGITGDWNNDGKDTTGVFRPGNGIIFLKDQNTTGIADVALNYGLPGDKPVIGDWNNDGTDTIGVYRDGTFFLRNSNTNGFAELVFDLGNPGDLPIAGNWDGLP